MSGVINHTERQINIKAMSNKGRVTVRLKPGFNVVNDEHWKAVQGVEYTKDLKKAGKIDFGKKVLEDQADLPEKGEEAQSKETPNPSK